MSSSRFFNSPTSIGNEIQRTEVFESVYLIKFYSITSEMYQNAYLPTDYYALLADIMGYTEPDSIQLVSGLVHPRTYLMLFYR